MIRTFWGMSIAVFLWAGITQAQESSINTALTSNSTKMVLRMLDRVAGARQTRVKAGEALRSVTSKSSQSNADAYHQSER